MRYFDEINLARMNAIQVRDLLIAWFDIAICIYIYIYTGWFIFTGFLKFNKCDIILIYFSLSFFICLFIGNVYDSFGVLSYAFAMFRLYLPWSIYIHTVYYHFLQIRALISADMSLLQAYRDHLKIEQQKSKTAITESAILPIETR